MTADELKAKIDLEGDRKDFTYKEHECRVLRMPITGHLCGYVGVCTSSSLHGIDYGSLDSVEVHDGLTYSGEMPDSDKWWFGFDCAHYGDHVPFCSLVGREVYRDMRYVTEELKSLVDQIINIEEDREDDNS